MVDLGYDTRIEMKGKKLILTVGLPQSGKSTWALTTGYPIVCRDAIRLALHYPKTFVPEAEDLVTALETYMVKALFLAGHDIVIVDATHLKSKYIDRWTYGPWEVVTRMFNTDVVECVRRAIANGREDLVPVIESMAIAMTENVGLVKKEE